MNPGCWKVDENDEAARWAKTDRHHRFSDELWTELYSTKSTGSKAIYIDIDDENDDKGAKEYSQWSDLPDLILEKIFSYLHIRERYYCSLVCKNWYRAFSLPYVWSRFVLEDTTLTRARFNYYCGWQYVLDHVRTSCCLSTVGNKIRYLTIMPMMNFYNLYEFMNMISWYMEQKEEKENVKLGIGTNIEWLKFTFPCNMTTRDDTERIRLFGTGGKLLEALKRLMGNLKNLRNLLLIDLMLDPKDAQYLLDEVVSSSCLALKTLYVVNTTKVYYPLLHVGVFLNLHKLVISPQNLGDDVVELLGNTNLKHLHILQNRYSPDDENINPVSAKVWKQCKKNNPDLCVHLQLECVKPKPLIWQECAPVKTVLYNSTRLQLRTDELMTVVDFYRTDLRVYGHLSIARIHRSKSFHERIDGSLLLLVRECPKLTTLAVTERISTATVLLLAYTGKNLRRLHIRKNAVIIKSEWPQSPEWSDEFYLWLKINSRSYELVEKEVSQIVGYEWKFLSDKEYIKLRCNLYEP
ncbi:uncharacterized protein LOC109609546 isoform X2 [Aethina tumida]|uniref:uncharacterized protein LOC109609546 isoform X2 n=1 Tax=Aethina tumida TaxID=116153 RepID=UPI00096B24DA|nr:uncharacterized protein LOC109609546 isoform X2 [Aethina tumida]